MAPSCGECSKPSAAVNRVREGLPVPAEVTEPSGLEQTLKIISSSHQSSDTCPAPRHHRESSAPLQAVEDGYVPVVKFEFDGVEIDLVFTRLSVQAVSDNLGLRDDWHLRSLDTRCIWSLN
ncbi:poly(A) polymerase gamma-like, partial [Strix uralensis]